MSTYTPNYNLEKPDAGDDFGDFRANYNSNMDIIDANWGGGGGGSASDVTYDNTSSGLTATNVQDAIDEVVGDIPTALSDLTADSTHRVVTDAQISAWNGKQDALTAGNGIDITSNVISVTPFYITGDTTIGFTPHYS